MNKTTNYQLNQWERTDRVLMEDFNADNARIDGALAGKAEAASVQALEQQTAALAAAMPKIVFGVYTGDGATSRVINLGFTPKAVYTCVESGCAYYGGTNSIYYGGLALPNLPVGASRVNPPICAMEIVDGGFRVFCQSSSRANIRSNEADVRFYYIAFG